MSIITVDSLSKSYKNSKVKAVDNASFQIEKGEVFGLIGPNGAGKTTIFSCLLALTNPSSGTIEIDGRSPQDIQVKAMLGFLPERPCYNRWMTVRQFLQYHHGLAGHPASEREAEIKRVLALVELDVDPKKRRIKELSRGMLQRIGLAQALIGKPQICFLDEPTSGMDPLGFILIRKLLLKLKEEGMTIVLNSHHLLEVERVCDRVAFIRRGKIEEVSSLADLNTIRQMLKVEWLPQTEDDPTRQEKLAQLADACQCPLLESSSCGAKFAVATNEKAAELLAGLQKENFSVYQSTFEKKELVELFLNERATDIGSEVEPDQTGQKEGQK